MATNVAIDDRQLTKALHVGGFGTKRETVNEALRQFIQRRERVDLIGLFGTVNYDPKYDYRKDRRRR